MFKRNQIFGVFIVTVGALAMIACSNGGGNNNNNPCNQAGYNPAYAGAGYNPAYQNPSLYTNPAYANNPAYVNQQLGGCTGMNQGINNPALAAQIAQQRMGQGQISAQQQIAAAQAQLTREQEENRRLRDSKARRARHSSDDSDSDSDPAPKKNIVTDSDTHVVISGTTTRIVSVAPAQQQVVQQQPVQQQVMQQPVQQQVQQQTYNGTNTTPTNGVGSTVNQPVVPNLPISQLPPPQSPEQQLPAQPDIAQNQPVDQTGTVSGGQQQQGNVDAPPPAPAQQQQPDLVPGSLRITLQYTSQYQASDARRSNAVALLMSYVNITKDPTQWANNIIDSDYENGLTNSTELKSLNEQIKKLKKGKTKKTVAYSTFYNTYIPNGLLPYIQRSRLCDITTSMNGACIVVERDTRNDLLIDRAYVVAGYRKDPSNDSVENYKVARAELPANDNVREAVHTLLHNSTQKLVLISPLPAPANAEPLSPAY